jgi:hypothetical protein
MSFRSQKWAIAEPAPFGTGAVRPPGYEGRVFALQLENPPNPELPRERQQRHEVCVAGSNGSEQDCEKKRSMIQAIEYFPIAYFIAKQ